jgi:putative ABC transport system permease protein
VPGRPEDRPGASGRRLVNGDVVAQVAALPQVASVDPGLLAAGTARAGGHQVDLAIEVLADHSGWTPTLTSGTPQDGITLADKAARDLRVEVGDSISLEHPQATSTGLRTVRTAMRVAGIHPNPMRMLAYLDQSSADAFGLAGTTNLLTVTPADGVSPETVRRALLAVPHVASAQTAQATTQGMQASLDEFVGILQVAAAVTLLLALLIAFNTTTIGVDERAREHATMLAFGLPPRTVLGMTTVETVLVGVAGTAIGVLGGYALLRWMTATTIPSVLPEIGVTATLSPLTVVEALALGVLTVAIAPLFTLRRTRRMDIPSTLHVVE